MAGAPTESGARVPGVGVVVIGRDEGERLVRALRSALGQSDHVVYADSGSSDGSAARARALGARVVELDPGTPFTAARGRNAGFEVLRAAWPDVELVQFLDGDTELCDGWLAAGAAHLRAHPDVALVTGDLLERHPDSSPFHRLAAMEWSAPPGEIRSAGGNAMLRAGVLREVGGYRSDMIAGEEPELCVRLRKGGHRIVHLAREMGRHDADMVRLRQWWRRSVRDGHAYAEILHRHRRAPEPYWGRRVAAIALWGGLVPAASLGLAPFTSGWSLLGLGVLAAQGLRIARRARRTGASRGDAALYAAHCVVGKLAEFVGVLRFAWRRVAGRRGRRGTPGARQTASDAGPASSEGEGRRANTS